MYHPIKLRSDKGNKKAKGGKDKSWEREEGGTKVKEDA